jgi:hypothetical protein
MDTALDVLIGVYLGIGVLACVLSLIGQFIIPTRPQPGDAQENYARLPWRAAPTGLHGLRARAAFVLDAVTMLVVWPISVPFLTSKRIAGRGRPTFRSPAYSSFRYSAALRRQDLGVMAAAVFFGFAVALFAAAAAAGRLDPIQTACITLLVALVCQFCGYAVGTTDLPSALRRERLNPYLAAITITLFEFAAIVIASLLLNRWPADGYPGVGTFVDEARRVLALGHVPAAITSTQDAPFGVLIAAAGLSFYALVAKQLTQFRRFRRSAEDYAHIGQRHMFSGDVDQARRLIDSLPPEDRNSSTMLGLRARVLLAEGSFDAARELTQALFTVSRDPSSMYFATSTQEDLFWWMARQSIPFAHWRLFDELRRRGVSDGFLYSCVAFNCMYDQSEESTRRIAALRNEKSCPITASYCAFLTAESSERETAATEARDVLSSCASSTLITDSIIARVAGIEIGIRSGLPLDDDLAERCGEVVRDARTEGVPVWALYVVWQRLSGCISIIEAIHGRRDIAREIESQLAPVLVRLSPAERRGYRAGQRSVTKELTRLMKELGV